jgi:hypothetical protein
MDEKDNKWKLSGVETVVAGHGKEKIEDVETVISCSNCRFSGMNKPDKRPCIFFQEGVCDENFSYFEPVEIDKGIRAPWGKFYHDSALEQKACPTAARPAATPEPMSTGNGEVVLTEVIRDLFARDEIGRKKYHTSLKTDNGRDALMDAYQEACDLVMYLKQAIMERGEI